MSMSWRTDCGNLAAVKTWADLPLAPGHLGSTAMMGSSPTAARKTAFLRGMRVSIVPGIKTGEHNSGVVQTAGPSSATVTGPTGSMIGMVYWNSFYLRILARPWPAGTASTTTGSKTVVTNSWCVVTKSRTEL